MLFREKNEYTNPIIEDEIQEKWFSVYNYISLKELFMTVQRDYLAILSVINVPFGIITIVLWVLSYASGNFALVFGLLWLSYTLIFWILFFKLIKRSFYFLYVSNVVYTKKWIILWDDLYAYTDQKNLDKKLWEYEEMFDEYLSRPSRLEQVILQKKSQVLQATGKAGKKVLDIAGNFRSEESFRLMIPIFLSYGVYVWLLYAFYYLGYFFWLFIFYSVYVLLKILFTFKENTEIKIKQSVESIGSWFEKMEKIDDILTHKIQTFRGWEISNIAGVVESQFSNFYSEVLLVLKKRTQLLSIIKTSKYKDFIDFETLEIYVTGRFNKPVKEMLLLLEKTEKMLVQWLEEIKKIDTCSVDGSGNILQKEKVLSHQLELLKHNKTKLEASMM